jgi:hypothetical protein
MSVWALVFAGIMAGAPIAEIGGGYQSEEECKKVVEEIKKDIMSKVSDTVMAIGVGCVEVKPAPGKPV